MVLDEEKASPDSSIHAQGCSRSEALNSNKNAFVSPEEDEKTQRLSEGLTLLLAARERVLTLSEQRVSHSFSILVVTA